MAIDRAEKKAIIEQFRSHSRDTGSPAVQISLLTKRINYLSEHFKLHPKDFGSRHGLLKMVGHRRHLLNYLKKYDPKKYQSVIDSLDLRK